ncbi:MAG: hypothetical protein J3R72DRAFT_527423 [Linnemannia gamsii]|nr:MAG: hypothetical protein J3R72DRAFT_527423 [Linnemannia gamsii]
MSLFKRSNKNKSASAASTPASTPAQTPRASMQTIRDSGIKMTPEEALYKISQTMMTNASTVMFNTATHTSIFNSPELLDSICDNLSGNQITACLQVSHSRNGFFLLQASSALLTDHGSLTLLFTGPTYGACIVATLAVLSLIGLKLYEHVNHKNPGPR